MLMKSLLTELKKNGANHIQTITLEFRGNFFSKHHFQINFLKLNISSPIWLIFLIFDETLQ